jgi:threonine dehydratase
VLAAHDRIRPYIHRTPILTSSYLNGLTGAELFFKCENFQKAGAFKVRGACNAVFGLSDEKAKRGVATHSSGNHALSLSYAAGRRGIPCHVVMPRTAPEGQEGRGARLRRDHHRVRAVDVEPRRGVRQGPVRDRRRVRPSLQRRAGDRRAGHLLEGDDRGPRRARRGGGADRRRRHGVGLVPDALDHRAQDRDLRRRTEAADDAYQSFKSGAIVAYDAPSTVADGLKVPLKDRTWHFVSRHVTDVLLASEEEIVDAMKLTWQRMKIVIEPSCAVPLAVILKNPDVFAGKRVGVIITGGNVDLDKLPWIKA